MNFKRFTIWICVLTCTLIPIGAKAEECTTNCNSSFDINAKNDDVPQQGGIRYDNGTHKYTWDGQTGSVLKVGDYQMIINTGDYGAPSPTISCGQSCVKQNPAYSEWWDGQVQDFKNAIANGEELTGSLKMFDDALKANGYNSSEEYISFLEENGSALQYDLYPGAYINGELMTALDSGTDSYNECMRENFGCYVLPIAQASCGQGYITNGTCSADDTGIKECKQITCLDQNPDHPELCEDKPIDELVQPVSCNSTPVTPTPIKPKTPPTSFSSGGACGGTYVSVDYSISTTACGYVDVLNTTTKTAQLPDMGGTILAGKSFNFQESVNVNVTSSYQIYDQSRLRNEIAKQQSIIINIKKQIECIKENIKKYQDVRRSYSSSLSSCRVCKEYYKYDPTVCMTYACDSDTISNYELRIKELDTAIASEQQKLVNIYKSTDLSNAVKKMNELSTCASQISVPASSSSSYTTSVSATMSIDNYSQVMGSIKGISKGNGELLTQSQLKDAEYLPVTGNFTVPTSTKNGSNGSVNATVSGLTSLSCPFNVANYIKCSGNNCGVNSGGINVIYRPISLTNPFPNEKDTSTYRQMGLNWNASLADSIVKNNRGVSDYEVYNKEPIYTITLTPSTIKEIRKYNKEVPYRDFDMSCTDGYLCSSNFLWGTTTNGYNFSNIVVTSESCATANGWENCYGGGN